MPFMLFMTLLWHKYDSQLQLLFGFKIYPKYIYKTHEKILVPYRDISINCVKLVFVPVIWYSLSILNAKIYFYAIYDIVMAQI